MRALAITILLGALSASVPRTAFASTLWPSRFGGPSSTFTVEGSLSVYGGQSTVPSLAWSKPWKRDTWPIGKVPPVVHDGKVYLAFGNVLSCIDAASGGSCAGYSEVKLSPTMSVTPGSTGRVYAACPISPAVVTLGVGAGAKTVIAVVCRKKVDGAADAKTTVHFVDPATGDVTKAVDLDQCPQPVSGGVSEISVHEAARELLIPVVQNLCRVDLDAASELAPIAAPGCKRQETSNEDAPVVTSDGSVALYCPQYDLRGQRTVFLTTLPSPKTAGATAASVRVPLDPITAYQGRIFAHGKNVIIAGASPGGEDGGTATSDETTMMYFEVAEGRAALKWTAKVPVGTGSSRIPSTILATPAKVPSSMGLPPQFVLLNFGSDADGYAVDPDSGTVTKIPGALDLGSVTSTAFQTVPAGDGTDGDDSVMYSGYSGLVATPTNDPRASWSYSQFLPVGSTDSILSAAAVFPLTRGDPTGADGASKFGSVGFLMYSRGYNGKPDTTTILALTAKEAVSCAAAASSCGSCLSSPGPAPLRKCGWCTASKTCMEIGPTGVYVPAYGTCDSDDGNLLGVELACPDNFMSDALKYGLIAGGSVAAIGMIGFFVVLFHSRRRRRQRMVLIGGAPPMSTSPYQQINAAP